MKRLLAVAAVVLLAAGSGAGARIVTADGPSARQVADVLPYAGSTSPLPVPELVIQQGPWKDPLPEMAVPATRLGAPDAAEGCPGSPWRTTSGVQICQAD